MLMCFGITNSQTRDTIVPRLSDNEFQELKKEYLEVSKTNLVKRKTHFERLYFYRRSIWTPSEVMYNEKSYEEWLTENLYRTGFSNPQEATSLLRKMRRLKRRFEKRYPELREKLGPLTMKQRGELDWKSY